ncbi:hypothetical protein EDC01DRAFT_718394 [Geopyxis carbonaria]|nr:hypothetical protein EDC01DRAFT_718394 [Geopyxis carbonaria]
MASAVSSPHALAPKTEKLYGIRDAPTPALTLNVNTDFDLSFKYKNEIPIVIDNGSWRTRCGFASDPTPRLVCPPLVARYLDRKIGRKYIFGGYDTYVDATARGQAKGVFDGNIVSNFDALEMLLDYSFIKLGLEGGPHGGLGHPLVLTEAVCNPNYSRRMVTELVFEGYDAPSLVYGIDALFSYAYNGGHTGLVMSSGNTSTHLIPMIDGKGITSMTTRLNWGGSQGTEIMLKLLQLKYPGFPSKLQSWQIEGLMMDHCYVSGDYKDEISTYLDMEVLEQKDRVIQFPFTETVKIEKSQEELDKIAEKRKESGRRLQEQAAKARLEKLIKKEQELEYYRDLQSKAEGLAKREFKRLLESNDLDNESQLEKIIKELDGAIKRGRKQDVGDDKETAEEPPSFPLIDVPDEELDDEGKKQKRQQRLMKSNHDARQRARAEKEAEKQRIADEERKDQEAREHNLDDWVSEKRAARDNLMAKLKERQRLRLELTDRKSVASRMRMETIANLASDAPTGKKRRRGGNADTDDTFGANDDDWAVYRSVGAGGTGGNEDGQEEEEEMNRELKSIEALLLAHDPNFGEDHTREAQSDWSKSRIHAFLRGCRPFDVENQAEQNQMHINVERIRVPEVVFEPSMAGVDQAGIIEIASDILTHRISNPIDQQRVLKDVFLTGGNTAFKGFDERLRKEMISVLPTGLTINVRKAKDPCLDAWHGASQWCSKPGKDSDWRRAIVTKEEYLEKGSDYIKEHRLGNAFA